jgi:hypothetical protein
MVFRSSFLGFVSFMVLIVTAISMSPLSACNIPVFRYALERWKPDSCRLLIFHETQLASQDASMVRSIQLESADTQGSTNYTMELVDLRNEMKGDHAFLWNSVKANAQGKMPYATLQCKISQDKTLTQWHGSLSDLSKKGLFADKTTIAITKRLLSGDAIVWVMVPGTDSAKNEATRELLRSTLPVMEKKIKLPEGIGLPGSELYSEVPLLVKFSMMELDVNKPDDQSLIPLFRGIRSDRPESPLVIPVFGKARALEVVPGETLDEGLIEDLTMFLCGACSCQVKERNPGFDLMVTVNWNRELFGEGADVPATVSTLAREPSTPRKLAIPPGRK